MLKNIKVQFSNFIKTHKDDYKVCGDLITTLVGSNKSSEELKHFAASKSLPVVKMALEHGDYKYADQHIKNIAVSKNSSDKTRHVLLNKDKQITKKAAQEGNYHFLYEKLQNKIRLCGGYSDPKILPFVAEMVKPLTMAVIDQGNYKSSAEYMEEVVVHMLSTHSKTEEALKISKSFDKIVDKALVDGQYEFIQRPIESQIYHAENDPVRLKKLGKKYGRVIEMAIAKEDCEFVQRHAFSPILMENDPAEITAFVDRTDRALVIAVEKGNQRHKKDILDVQKRALNYVQSDLYKSGQWAEKLSSVRTDLKSIEDQELRAREQKEETLQQIIDRFSTNYPVATKPIVVSPKAVSGKPEQP